MISRVSPIYDNSYVGLWMFQAIGIEYDKLWNVVNTLTEQLFPESATWAIALWEDRYGITPDPLQTIEKRREAIIEARTKHRLGSNQIINYLEENSGGKAEIVDYDGDFTFAVKIENKGRLSAIDLIEAIKFINKNKPSHLSYTFHVDNKKALTLYTGCGFYTFDKTTFRVSSDDTPMLNYYADEFGDMLLDEHGYPLIVED